MKSTELFEKCVGCDGRGEVDDEFQPGFTRPCIICQGNCYTPVGLTLGQVNRHIRLLKQLRKAVFDFVGLRGNASTAEAHAIQNAYADAMEATVEFAHNRIPEQFQSHP